MGITAVGRYTIHRPLVYMLLAYLSGIVFGYYVSIGRLALSLIMVIALLAAVLFFRYKQTLSCTILLLVAFNLIGHLLFTAELAPVLPSNHVSLYAGDRKVVIEGVLYRSPQIFPSRSRYHVQSHKIIEREREIPVSGKLLLTAYRTPQRSHFSYGDVVRFMCRIRLPRNFNNPGSFNYVRHLAYQDIFATASLDTKHKMVKVGHLTLNPILDRTERCRTEIQRFITDHLSSPEAEIAIALITGEQSSIPRETREQFSIAGAAHILAISGLHIGIISLLGFTLFKYLLRCSARLMLMANITKLAAILTLPPLIIYCLIAGAGVAAIRATVMVTVYLVSLIIDRQDDLWNTLACAAFCILVVSPSALFDCSFQLSFASVASILYLQPRLCISLFRTSPRFPGLPKPWYQGLLIRGMSLLTVTLSASIGTAPLIALYFNRCSPWGIPANLIVVPLTGFLVVPLGLLTSLLIFVSLPLAGMTACLMAALLCLSNAVVAFFSSLPFADYRITTPTLPELVLYYAGMILLFKSKVSLRARCCLVLVIAAAIADCGYWYYQNKLNSRLRITAIDVGQGESTLLQLPRGKTILIDGGGSYDNSFDIGSMVVAPLLWRKKISRIDYVVLSHPHPDHLNGLVSVVKNFDIGEVWTNGEGIATEAYAAFEALIAERKIKKRIISRGHPHAYVNGIMIQFLHPGTFIPDEPMRYAHDRMNNNSLVMRVSYRDVSILFTGDIGAVDEREIMTLYPGLTCTILKIPHHGSVTSSSKAFLEMLRPRIALLSVGSGNSFRLPHPDVVKRYEEAGCRIFRTDRDGAVSLETDGRRMWIKTHVPSWAL